MDPNQQQKQLHVVFLPFMAQGHMIPIIDMARLFARHGVKSTIITTPVNAPLFSGKIDRDAQLGLPIKTHIIEFPSPDATGLPPGCENGTAASKSPDLLIKFFMSMALFQRPVAELLELWRPDCIVAGVVFTWATETAHKLGIPRLYFNGTGSYAMCLFNCLTEHKPHEAVESDSEPFLLPGLPHEIRFTKLQIPPYWKGEETEDSFKQLRQQMEESEVNSFGAVVNSFHELEPGYSEYYRNVMGRKAWFVGPLSLCNKDGSEEKAERGDVVVVNAMDECLAWLDSKDENSVLYICFGSISTISNAQLHEIAAALESEEIGFVWVVKKEESLPEGFEERSKGKGLVIKGWAPQVLILDHGAVGGFVTHCGWNSTLEGVAAGVPMVTWPLQAEQFCNEKLVTDVLRIGVGVGAQEWSRNERKIVVGREDIERAIARVMVGEEADELRGRAMELKEMAARAHEDGGSSNSDLKLLLEELASVRDTNGDGWSKLKKQSST